MTTQIDASQQMARLLETMAPARQSVVDHALYKEIRTIEHLRIFLQSHVFAVWDFMSLLKSLQAALTCVTTPWLPSPYPKSRRLINEIVLGEESDSFENGFLSHFELYLRAMSEAGADPAPMQTLVQHLKRGRSLEQALQTTSAPAEAKQFVRTTFSFIDQAKPHVVLAAFTFGREDLISQMFLRMVQDLRQNLETVGLFEYYLTRHVEMDGDEHGPMALQMVAELCGDDETKWEEAAAGAVQALEARVALWDGILTRIQQNGNTGHPITAA